MNNKLPTVNIKGSQYTLVKDRVIYFNETFKNGRISTELITHPDAQRVIVKATVVPDVGNPERYFSDYSQAVIGEGYINKTSALENCSTSAIGRALALMAIGVIDSIASADEINKANQTIQRIQNNEPISGDDMEQAIEYDRPAVFEATRKVHAQKRQEYKTNKQAYNPEL